MMTNDDELASTLRMIANHGQSKRYYHDRVGCNSRLDSVQAAVLRIKLQHLDSYNDARQNLAAFYDQAFQSIPGITIPVRKAYSTHVYHQYTLQVNPELRDRLHEYLAEREIPSMIYYPVPAHRQLMFSAFGCDSLALPVTDYLTERVISLPMHTEMRNDQRDYIVSTIHSFFNQL